MGGFLNAVTTTRMYKSMYRKVCASPSNRNKYYTKNLKNFSTISYEMIQMKH